MNPLDNDITFLEWETLSFSQKCEIWNHHWDPYIPQVGASTKKEIINNFIKKTSLNGLQYGIKSFGWGGYMLFVIVDNSKIRVPKQFSDLPVNKGVVKEWMGKNQVEVKFSYGGTFVVNIEEKIVVG